MAKRTSYKLTPQQIKDLMWDFVAGVKTTALTKKYGISKTTVKYYRNPMVHKARLRRFYMANRLKENARSKAYREKRKKGTKDSGAV